MPIIKPRLLSQLPMPQRPSFVPAPSRPEPAATTQVVAEVMDPRLSRTAYFDGRLLTADDLIRDQIYLDERLREAGRVLGDGVISGLELSLNEAQQRLTIGPGAAVTPQGRTLMLDDEVIVPLGERAAISRLNDNRAARFPSGIYAIVLRYAEREDGLAEAYPVDLASARELRPDAIREGVEAVLVPLDLPVPSGGEALARAQLAVRIIGHEAAAARLPEDGVALGVVAMRDDAPRWIDQELLRHPRRLPFAPNAAVADLARHYAALHRRVRSERVNGLSPAYAASDYFRRLPPYGPLPKAALDPESGTQSFFPEHIQVWLAPVRSDDLAHIQREALELDWIDLDSAEPAEVLVLARLEPAAYAAFADRIEVDPNLVESRTLPSFDGLRLRLVRAPRPHRLDTDAASWKELWNSLPDGDLFFVRRQPRASEAGVSGIILARGYLPPARLSQAEAERARILVDQERIRIFDVDRGPWAPTSERGRLAKDAMKALLREREDTVIHILPAMEKMGVDSGDAPWLTLDAARRKGVLAEFSKEVGQTPGAKSPRTMSELVRRFDLGEEIEQTWTEDPELAVGFDKAVDKFPSGDAEGEQARKDVLEAVRERPELGAQVLPLLKGMAADDPAAPWLTVAAAVKNGAISGLAELMKRGATAKTPTAMAKIAEAAGLDDVVTERWLKQAPR